MVGNVDDGPDLSGSTDQVDGLWPAGKVCKCSSGRMRDHCAASVRDAQSLAEHGRGVDCVALWPAL